MSILIDPVTTHDSSNDGSNTVPPGITGLDWCHVVSDTSEVDLTDFLTANLATIGCPVTNVRTPLLGSLITYAGLSASQRDSAITAGAITVTRRHCIANAFDAGDASTYEPFTSP